MRRDNLNFFIAFAFSNSVGPSTAPSFGDIHLLETAGTVDIAPELSNAVGFAGVRISSKAAESEVNISIAVVVAPGDCAEEVGTAIISVGYNEGEVAVFFDRESAVTIILIKYHAEVAHTAIGAHIFGNSVEEVGSPVIVFLTGNEEVEETIVVVVNSSKVGIGSGPDAMFWVDVLVVFALTDDIASIIGDVVVFAFTFGRDDVFGESTVTIVVEHVGRCLPVECSGVVVDGVCASTTVVDVKMVIVVEVAHDAASCLGTNFEIFGTSVELPSSFSACGQRCSNRCNEH